MKRLSDKRLFALLTFVIWTLVALFEFTRTKIMILEGSMIFGTPMRPGVILVSPLIKFYVWFILGLFIYDLYYKVRKLGSGKQVLVFVLLGIGAVSLHYVMGNIIYNLYLYPPSELFEQFRSALKRFFSNMPMSSLNYASILLMITALDLNKRYRQERIKAVELESELSKAQLDNLKMQLRPHFIFNALNTISMLVRKNDNKEAVEMISGMSDLLRTTLGREETHEVKLSYELDLLKKYLDIEQSRFKEKLKIRMEIDPKSLDVHVPNLVLQPIVENAFKHGFNENLEASEINIKAQVSNNRLELTVFNTGELLKEGWTLKNSGGIGLKNTRSRLKNIYGEQAVFSISNHDKRGVKVQLSIPIVKEKI